MDEIIKMDSVDKYNKLFGLETLHPLVSVIDLSEAASYPTHFTINYGVYALFLKDTLCGDIRYGKQTYDYQEGTVVSFAPGQVVETVLAPGVKPKAQGVLFHPDLIKVHRWERKSSRILSFRINRTKRFIFQKKKKASSSIAWQKSRWNWRIR